MSTDTEGERIKRHISTWALPSVIALLILFAQNNYADMKAQLTRIETKQVGDTVTLTELRYRILALEQWIAAREQKSTPTEKRTAPQT